jgi:hypothetical protein
LIIQLTSSKFICPLAILGAELLLDASTRREVGRPEVELT